MPCCTLLCECIMVSIETVSPELMVSFGGSFGSSQPHCTVSSITGCRRRSRPCSGAGSLGGGLLLGDRGAGKRGERRRKNHPSVRWEHARPLLPGRATLW